MGGTDDPMNLIELTIEEHAEAHRELWEYCGRWQDYLAWKALSGQMTKEEVIKFAQKNANKEAKRLGGKKGGKAKKPPISEDTREKLRQRKNFLGKKHSEETKQKMSVAKIGMKHTELAKQNISKGQMGRVFSEETRRKIGLTKLGNQYGIGNKGGHGWPKGKKRKKEEVI